MFSTPTFSAVTRDPSGSELGIHAVTLTPALLADFGPVIYNPLSPSQPRLQFVRTDHVTLPTLPGGWISVGASAHCAPQVLYDEAGGRILTLQGHAESDRFVNAETVRKFGTLAGWNEDFLAEALEATEGIDDSLWMAGVIFKFFVRKEIKAEEGRHISARF